MESKYSLRLLFVFIAVSLNLFAIDGKIKVFITSKDAIYTSQKITVSVELLSDAFSITDAKITFPASKKYIVQAPGSAAYLGQEEVEGEAWQMVHYEYEVYALQAGKIEIPSVSVSFTASMGYGQPKKEFALKSESLYFDVNSPKGVKSDQFVLVTDRFKLDFTLKPEKEQIIVGDAVALNVIQKAKGVPDILLTPVIYKSNASLRVYEKEPELKSGEKGKFDVSRTDRFTFVASGEGNVTLAAQEVFWWNSVTKELQTEKIPAISFEILPDPQIAIDAKRAVQKQQLIYFILGLLALIVAYILFARKIKRYFYQRKREYMLSEEGRFKILLESCHHESIGTLYHHLYAWLDVADPMLSREGFHGIREVQPSFSEMLTALESALSIPHQSLDKAAFICELEKLRNKLLKRDKDRRQGLPQNLNP